MMADEADRYGTPMHVYGSILSGAGTIDRLLAGDVGGIRFVNAGRRRLRGLRGRHRLFEAVYWE